LNVGRTRFGADGPVDFLDVVNGFAEGLALTGSDVAVAVGAADEGRGGMLRTLDGRLVLATGGGCEAEGAAGSVGSSPKSTSMTSISALIAARPGLTVDPPK
jgi:hypothetical protein